jgi:aminoglycoside phosphotransferase (APT) family kinase protein
LGGDHVQAQAADRDVVLIDTAGFGNTTAAFGAGTADYVLVPVMPDRASTVEAMRMARQVASFAKASRRDIPVAIVRSRWNPKGLVERAAGAAVTTPGAAATFARHRPGSRARKSGPTEKKHCGK